MKQWSLGMALTITTLLGFHQIKAQKVIQERASLNTSLIDDGKGVVSAGVHIDYLVRRMDDDVVFSLSYSQITINADAGYYYNGKKYGKEVPGLIEKLRSTRGTYPTVRFDVYYGNIKQESFTYAISARNDLGALTGDLHSLKTTKDKLDQPNWRLVANGFETFNYSPDPTIWVSLNELIIKYEREKKAKTEYDDLIRDADQLYTSKQLDNALKAYLKASNHHLADAYPKSQFEKIRTQLAKDEKEGSFKNAMANGEEAEKNQDYSQALAYYNSAAKIGVDDYNAQNAINRVQRTMDNLKRKQEEEITSKAKENKIKQEEFEKQQLKDKNEADRILREKEEELEQKNKEELDKLEEELNKKEREKLQDEREEMFRKEAAEKKRIEDEEELKEKKERSDRRADDEKTISKYEADMSYNPVLFNKNLAEAQKFHNNANQIKPYEALELKSAWWDMNHYMESFRDDLNEPRRQQAWQKCQQLLYNIEGEYEAAKYYYMAAIKYTDQDSWEHKYLLDQVKMINASIDFQKDMIKSSQQGEQQRKKSYEDAKVYKYLSRINDNREKARQTYHILTQDYMYPNLNSKVSGSENALQRQYNFENRLNKADEQLKVDNLVTGVTSQIAVSAMVDDSKSTHIYGNHAMGINLFAFTGYASYPIVANEIPTQGYIPQTFVRALVVAPFQGGFDWWIHRGNSWDIGITGDFMLGVLPIMGYKNFFFGYGGNLKFNVGVKAVKLAIEADWHQRSGSYEYDQDVAMSDVNNPWQQPTDLIFTGDFNYSVLKAGAGLHINLADKSDDGYVRLMMYAEKPSFHTGFNMQKPVFSGGGQVVFRGGITVSFDYAKNYSVAGKAENMLSAYDDRDFFKFTFGKTWTIGKTK